MAQKKKSASPDRARIATIVAEYGVRGAARKLGIDRRTVQRQLNQGQVAKKTAPLIVREAAAVRLVHQRAARRAGIELRSGVTARGVRTSRLDPTDPKRERRIRGHTIRFFVGNMHVPEIAQLLFPYRGEGRAFYLIKKMPKGSPEYPTLARPQGFGKRKESDHEASKRYDLDARIFETMEGLTDTLAEEATFGKIIYLNITDPIMGSTPKPKRKRK